MRDWGRARADDARPRRDGPPLPGVIDTLGLGYAALAARPLAILPLLALELCLLFLPQLQLRPLTNAVADAASGRGSGWEDVAADAETFADYNAFELAALRLPLMRMPALVPVADADRVRELPWSRRLTGAPAWTLPFAALVALAVGFVLAALHQLLAAATVGARSVAASLRPAAAGAMARDLVAWAGVVFGMLALLSVPMLVLTGVGVAFGFPEVSIVWLLLTIPFVWGYVHFYFSIPALALERQGATRSLRASYRVVRASFWQTAQLIALSLLISTGLTYALRSLATSAPGILLAVVLNAVVATGLLIAAMLFYRDRAARLGLTESTPGR